MVVMNSQRLAMDTLVDTLRSDFPALTFQIGQRFLWSSKQQIITYKEGLDRSKTQVWSLLHEVGHGLLKHRDFGSDFELLQLEVAAWQKAKQLAKRYGYQIDEGHIEDCLDSYRDWLYARSTCPSCTSCSLQIDQRRYQCFNCNTVWRVSASRLCRPYRRTALF